MFYVSVKMNFLFLTSAFLFHVQGIRQIVPYNQLNEEITNESLDSTESSSENSTNELGKTSKFQNQNPNNNNSYFINNETDFISKENESKLDYKRNQTYSEIDFSNITNGYTLANNKSLLTDIFLINYDGNTISVPRTNYSALHAFNSEMELQEEENIHILDGQSSFLTSSLTQNTQDVPLGDAHHLSVEYRLVNDLLSKYNNKIRPVRKGGDISHVLIELSLFDILKLDTKQQVMKTNTELIMKWIDIHLVWDPILYDNISIIRMPYQTVWYPDIILYNTAETDYQSSVMYTNVIIRHSGEVELVSHSIFSSICNVDIQWYPFDQQDCTLVFASWTYDEIDIQLILGPADMSDYHKNPEYFLENFYGEQQQTFNPCCKYPMSTVVYHIQLQRRTKFSLFFYLMPGILINLSAVMVFSLPAESGEKIGLGINSMLAMIVFLMAMTEKLPPTEKIPLAGLYYGVCLTVITLNIGFSVFILNLNFAGDRKKKIPEWLKYTIIFLTKFLRNRIPETVYEDWGLDHDKIFSKRHSIKTFLKSSENFNIVTSIGKEKSAENSYFLTENYRGYEGLKDSFQRRVVHALETMAEHTRKKELENQKTTKDQNLQIQWKFISRVLDRLLFLIFFGIAFFFNITILTSSPFAERYEYCPIGEGQCDGMTELEINELSKQLALEHARGHS